MITSFSSIGLKNSMRAGGSLSLFIILTSTHNHTNILRKPVGTDCLTHTTLLELTVWHKTYKKQKKKQLELFRLSLQLVFYQHKVHTGDSSLLCFWDSYLHSNGYILVRTSLRSTASQKGRSTVCHGHIHCSKHLVVLSPRVSHHIGMCSLLGVCLVAFVRQAIVCVASIVGATFRTPHTEAWGLHCVCVGHWHWRVISWILLIVFESEGRNSSVVTVPYTSSNGL